jgi:hypothetical protein
MAASFALSGADRLSRAVASAVSVSPLAVAGWSKSPDEGLLFAFSAWLVQTLVQTAAGIAASPCRLSLGTTSPQIVALRVEGSNPFSHPLETSTNDQ